MAPSGLKPTRRKILQWGATGLGSAALTGLVPTPAAHAASAPSAGGCPMNGAGGYTPSATFGRIFDLPAFAPNTPHLRRVLMAIGAPGGILDAKDDLFGPNGGR